MKQLINNIQQWLLFEGRCTSCGRSLEEGKQQSNAGQELIVCECDRVYEYNKQSKVYEISEKGNYLNLERRDDNVW